MNLRFLFTFLTIISVVKLFAQPPGVVPSGGFSQSTGVTGKIMGVVLDSTARSVVEFATVVLIDAKTGAQKDGTTTDEKGAFKFLNLKAGKYRLSLSFIGYKTKLTSDVELTPQQEKYYKAMKSFMMLQAAGEEISAVNAAANMNKLLQISCGAVYSDTGEVVRFDASNRLNVMDEIIDESDKKTIIFAPFRHTIEMIKDHLDSRNVGTLYIHGDVSPAKRGQIIQDFQNNEEYKVIVIQPQAASHGITLTAASSVIWFGPTSSVDTYLQANARAHRKGQDTKVTVFMIQGSPVEKHIYNMLETRVDSHVDLISMYKEILQI